MLFDEYDLVVDETTVWRTLHRLGWSRKRMRIASQRNPFLGESWFTALADWRPDQLVFLDESAACERTGEYPVAPIGQILTSSGDRKYGWTPLNMRPWVSDEFNPSKRWSLLPAFTIQGYLSWIILQGSVAQDIFIDFVRDHVLPYCSSFNRSEPLSVIICDNASIHHSAELVCMCHDADRLASTHGHDDTVYECGGRTPLYAYPQTKAMARISLLEPQAKTLSSTISLQKIRSVMTRRPV